MEQQEYNEEDYIRINIIINQAYFEQETRKAYCFRLWGVKFIAIPKSIMRHMTDGQYTFECTVPKWYIDKHNLKSIVHDDQKHLFPTKKELRQQQLEREQGNLFNRTVPDEVDKPIVLHQDSDDFF